MALNSILVNVNSQTQMLDADRKMLVVLLAHIPVVGLWVPAEYGTTLFALVSSLLVGGLAAATYVTCRGQRVCGILFGAYLMLFSAIMIQAQLGRIEMHFHIFSALALTIVYRDIAVIAAAAVTITVHHLALTALQLSGASAFGMDVMIFNYGCSWSIAFLHAAFVVFEAGVLSYFAYDMASERERNNNMVAVINDFEANGALTGRLGSADDTSRAFNNLMQGFERLITESKEVAASLKANGEELQQLSDNTRALIEKQNSEMQQASSATEEMTATIQEVSQNAQQAFESANSANADSEWGREQTQAAVAKTQHANEMLNNSVSEVESLSHEVKSISSLIDSISQISEQTNLLALNAAIEAARAGEHGRGFSVVADEVRNLSQRTNEFTGQIRHTIETLVSRAEGVNQSIGASQTQSQEATGILNETNEAIQRIDGAMKTLLSMNEQIATAAEEQATASSQINENIHHVSGQTEEALRSSQRMESIALGLSDTVNRVDGLVSPYHTNAD